MNNDIIITDVATIPTFQVKVIVMSATKLGCIFVKYELFNKRLFMIVPKSSEFFESLGGIKDFAQKLAKFEDGLKLMVKIIDYV